MGRAASFVSCWLGCALAIVPACSAARYAQTALDPSQPDSSAALSCPGSLSDRLSVTTIDVDVDIRYKRTSYDNFPVDERVSLAVLPDGSGYLAWIQDSDGSVRVTPLDKQLARRAADIHVPGEDIGGLVAQPDGFALLTRRTDPGVAPVDLDQGGAVEKAAFLVRYSGTSEAFAVPLTGTASITHGADPAAHDCTAVFLYGRLAWNGSKYGAYFQVHGCVNDPHSDGYGDKLVYADDRGRYIAGGWNWNCSTNQGLRLLAELDDFTAVCLADTSPYPGLNLVIASRPARQLAAETSSSGYVVGQFGALVHLDDDSYMVGWLSRATNANSPPKPANDIAMVRLGSDYTQLAPKAWLLETPTLAETNLHMAPYGAGRMLVIWESIKDLRCTGMSCFGTRVGTVARLSDLSGNWISAETLIDAVPNTGEDLTVFPNGDVGWAFVADEARSYANAQQTDRNGLAIAPSKRRVSIARLRLCGSQ